MCASEVCVVPGTVPPGDDGTSASRGGEGDGGSDAAADPTTTTPTQDGTGASTDTGAPANDTTDATTDAPVTTTGEEPPGCGDGFVQPGEDCEGGGVQAIDCTALGLGIGPVTCDAATCTFDTSACEPIPMPDCHPLANNCPAGSTCYASGNSFVCEPTVAGGGGWFDECTGPTTCAPYYACVPEAATPLTCDFDSCCVAYCTVGADNCGVPVCVAVYQPGTAPPGFENLGVCVF